jgi:hypothetical protein
MAKAVPTVLKHKGVGFYASGNILKRLFLCVELIIILLLILNLSQDVSVIFQSLKAAGKLRGT